MTVSYTSKVARAKQFGCFVKLLFRWRGSIYKLIFPDLCLFLAAFIFLGIQYQYVLSESGQRTFEKISMYCEKYGTLIPVAFVLGFYVSQVISRWWDQYKQIPWIDTLAILVHAGIRGSGEKDRILRRTVMRYACLAITQTFSRISPRVKKRFPTLDHFVESGLLLESEKGIMAQLEKTAESGAKYPTHFIALVWAAGLVVRGRAEDKVKNDAFVNLMLTEINKIKDGCMMLISYDWISLPLVYTQVVTLAVYTYFLACLMGKQWIKEPNAPPEKYEGWGVESIVVFFPVFTVLQFFFYMGWLKVAESLLNPFGDDDDDFELNWLVDRNIQVSYLIVDEMHSNAPDLLRDTYWNEVVPPALPHTVASEVYKEIPPESSTANLIVGPGGGDIVPSPYNSKLNLNSDELSTIIRKRSLISRQNTTAGLGSESGSPLVRIGSAIKRIVTGNNTQLAGVDANEHGNLVDVGSKAKGERLAEETGSELEDEENDKNKNETSILMDPPNEFGKNENLKHSNGKALN